MVKVIDPGLEENRIDSKGQLGIITGSGPEAGIDLWKKVLHGRRARLGEGYRGDLDAPMASIHSLPLLGLSMDMRKYNESVWVELNEAATKMAAECSAYTVACNTLHYFADSLKKIEGGKFVSVQDLVRDELHAREKRQFALLGASPVMSLGEWSPYSKLQDEFEIETTDGDRLDKLIFQIKAIGRSNSELSGEFIRIVNSLESEVVVLGCTELPLISPLPTKKILIDVTALLAEGLLNAIDSNL